MTGVEEDRARAAVRGFLLCLFSLSETGRKAMLTVLKKAQSWIDRVTTFTASALLAVMFLVLVANVVLRLIPAVGGFRWYMEFSQYANVWAMLIGAAGVAAMGTNLRVDAVDSVARKIPRGVVIAKIVADVCLIAFYCILAYSGNELSRRAIQKVSTMPRFKMGQVYAIFPAAGLVCAVSSALHLLVTLAEGRDRKEARGA